MPVTDQPVIRAMVWLSLLINVSSFLGPLYPALVSQRLHAGAAAYGAIESGGIVRERVHGRFDGNTYSRKLPRSGVRYHIRFVRGCDSVQHTRCRLACRHLRGSNSFCHWWSLDYWGHWSSLVQLPYPNCQHHSTVELA